MGKWKLSFDHSIRRKYLSIIGVTLSIVILTSVVLLMYMTVAQNSLDEQRSELQAKVETVDNIVKNLNKTILSARAHYLVHDTDSSDYKQKVDEYLEQLKEELQLYKQLSLSPEERQMYADLYTFYLNYKHKTFPEVSALAEENKYREIQKYNNRNASANDISVFLQKLEKFSDEAHEKLNDAFDMALNQAKLFALVEVFFSLAVLFLFIIIIGRILKDLIRPIEELEEATNAVAKGETFQLTRLERNDEIGALSSSFIKMAKTIQEKEEELTAQNEELLAQQEELTVQQNQLQLTLTEIESMNRALDQSAVVAISDANGVITYVNSKFYELTQYHQEELIGKSNRILQPEHHNETFFKNMLDTIKSGGVWTSEIQNKKKDGTTFWLNATIVPYLDPKGIPYQYILIGQDITSTKRTQEKLTESLVQTEQSIEKIERYNKLSHALTVTLNKQELLNEILVHLNEMYLFDSSIIALSEDKISSHRGLPDSIVDRFLVNVEQNQFTRFKDENYYVIQREAISSERGIAREAVKCYDIYVALFDGNNQQVGVFAATRIGHSFKENEIEEINGLMKQISLSLERILMYERVKYSRKLNRDIVNNVNEGIQLVSEKGDMIQYNEALYKLAGSTTWSGDIVDPTIWMADFTSQSNEKESLHEFFLKSIEESFHETRTLKYSIGHEERRYIDVYATSLFQGDEKKGTIFVHRDVTNEHEVDQMKSELVSTVSHELRTPLSSVLGFTELLMTKQLKPERQQKYLVTIHKEAKRLTNLINDFLDLQRMESGSQQYEMEPVKVNEIAMDVVSQFKYEKRHHVFLVDEAQHVEVLADQERLVQVFTNLMSNAIKFSPEGGDVKLTLLNDKDHLVISIKDDGLGISKDDIASLFRKFHRVDNSERRKIGGTGLGLAICKEIIVQHKGDIWIESEEGRGTTVCIKLPLLNHGPSETDIVIYDGQMESNNNVMIVEDDISLALLLSEELKGKGFKVIHHSDPSRAFQDAKKLPLIGIVIDLMLGEDMSGWDLINCLKEEETTKNIPIVISSALDKSEKQMEKYNIEKYLTKPFPPYELSTTIVDFLLQSETGDVLFPENNEKNPPTR